MKHERGSTIERVLDILDQAPASRISVDSSDRYIPLLREAAQELSQLADDD